MEKIHRGVGGNQSPKKHLGEGKTLNGGGTDDGACGNRVITPEGSSAFLLKPCNTRNMKECPRPCITARPKLEGGRGERQRKE